MISMGKKYRTRDGRDVRLLCVDNEGAFPVVFLLEGGVFCATKDGFHLNVDRETKFDLIEVRPRIKRDVWVNIYDDAVTDAEIITRHGAIPKKLARVKIVIDCEEGEGL